MEFKNKLKIRALVSAVIGILGTVLMCIGLTNANESASSFGLTFAVIGIARILQYKRITKDEETLHKRQVAETDERNVMLWTRARSLAFSVYIIVCAVAIIVLNVLDLSVYADILAYNLIAFVVIYWIIYFIISRKN